MIWYDKIRLGMELIREGCFDNHLDENCGQECPFKDYCWYTTDEPQSLPENWEVKNG